MTKAPPISAAELCALIGCKVPQGLNDLVITGISTLDAAGPSEVSFVIKPRYEQEALASRAGLLLAPPAIPLNRPNVVVVPEVMSAVLRLIAAFHPEPEATAFVHSSAIVHPTAIVENDVHVGAGVVIEEGARVGARSRIESGSYIGAHCVLGEGCVLAPNVTLLHATVLGKRVHIFSGAVLGADGFRFEMLGGRLQKIPQVGNVVVGDDVEIGANCTIDRAFLTSTRIGARTKMDNAVHVGHNVEIGSDCVIVAQVGIAGSTRIGRGVMIGGAASLKDHITVGDGSRIAGRAVVGNSLPPGSQVSGFPAVPVKRYARFTHFYKNFDEYWEKLRTVIREPKSAAPSDDQPTADRTDV